MKELSTPQYQGQIKLKNGKFPIIEDDEHITESHKTNIGKVVFSNSEIEFKNPVPAKWKNSFGMGEELYFRAYFKESAQNALANFINTSSNSTKKVRGSKKHLVARIKINYYLGGKLTYSGKYSPAVLDIYKSAEASYSDGFETKYTSLQGLIQSNEKTSVSKVFFDRLIRDSMPSGIHNVKVEFVAFDMMNEGKENREKVLAAGEMKFNFTPKDFKMNKKNCLPAAKTTNSAVEKLIKTVLPKNYSSKISLRQVGSSRYKDGEKVRDITVDVMFTEEGKCYRVVHRYIQLWNPLSASWSNTIERSLWQHKKQIHCDCLK